MGLSFAPLPDTTVSFNYPALSKRSPGNKKRIFVVEHNYHDHAWEDGESGTSCISDEVSAGNAAFPAKLYEMLSSVERDGFVHIVSWQPHGRSFLVHEPGANFKAILPRYFKLSKLASFQRQLNLYGFTRITSGLDKGGYYNEFFLQGKPGMSSKIQRIRVKGTGVRAKSNPAQEPNFWNMPWAVSSLSHTTTPMTHDFNTLPSAVVSQDFEEEPSLGDVQDSYEGALSLPENLISEGSLVFTWGMPFRYVPSGGTLVLQLTSENAISPEDKGNILDDAGIDGFMETELSAEDFTGIYSRLSLPGRFVEV
jgi:hypothetical protein